MTIKRFVPVPNEIFTLGLKSGEIVVYAYLLFCEDRKTYKCYPSYRTIGRAVGLSVNTVRKYVSSLEDKRLITTEPTTLRKKDRQVRNGNLLYTILPIQQAVEFNIQQQIRKAEYMKATAKLSDLCSSYGEAG